MILTQNNNRADSDQAKKPAKASLCCQKSNNKIFKNVVVASTFSDQGELHTILEDIGKGFTWVAAKTRPTECLF